MKSVINADWIWLGCGEEIDQYAEFLDTVCHYGKKTVIKISADSDYTLFVNGEYAASGQYGDYEHYKIYDTIDITHLLRLGENRLDFTVHHCGADTTSRYRPYAAGLIYEVAEDGTVTARSGEHTLSRLSPTYASGRRVSVSTQLGFTFAYDATKRSDEGYTPSVCVRKDCNFFPRPIKKHALRAPKPMKSVTKLEGNRYLIDLGGETVGLPHLEIESECEQTLVVAWGEHIKDGCVRSKIGYRTFEYEYRAVRGENLFTEYMLRIGGRYLEIRAEAPIRVKYCGIIPQVYETKKLPYSLDCELDSRIYEICLNTLECCMMEHYVDCPWREQALYAFDSRNQMLTGYYAYEDKNAEYARANLRLIAEDRREDGILSLCHPCAIKLTIPAFSLYYIIALAEYTAHTGDTTLIKEIYPKILEICDAFLASRSGALVHKLAGEQMWNFYDWDPVLKGAHGNADEEPDLIINAIFLLALNGLEATCLSAGVDFAYKAERDALRAELRARFMREDGLFTYRKGREELTVLGNSLVILSGAVSTDEASVIADEIVRDSMTPTSLSMNILKYEALLAVNAEKYKDYILSEIRRTYKIMLDAGSDTVWETILGEADFGGAGSLCHGWSSVPIYVYRRLGMIYEK